ncbi:uncharacterized protein UHOD_02992 [Ustilago sp. UG-2017b]|nr:uncharacterized protein UHOD_02992 [Ustilago sp. UG-2017b]
MSALDHVAEQKYMIASSAGLVNPLWPYFSLEEPCLVLDVRSDSAFHQAHLANSYHIYPIAELKSRYSYLPPRNVPFLVIADQDQRHQVAEAFASTPAARLIYLLEATPTSSFQSTKVDREAFFASAQQCGLLRTSGSHQDRITATHSDDIPNLLFRPSPAVQRTVLNLESSHSTAHTLRVLDLGCGAARDLAWILHASRSRTSPCSWIAVGVDNWKAALSRAQLLMEDLCLTSEERKPRCESMLWAKCSDAGYLDPLVGSGKGKSVLSPKDDAELWQRHVALGLEALLPVSTAQSQESEDVRERGFDLILSIRFHPRSLLRRLSSLVRTSGIVLLSHFVTLSPTERFIAAEAHPEAILDYESPPHEGRIQPGEVEALVERWNKLVEAGCKWVVAEEVLEPIEDRRIIKSVALRKVAM